MKIGIITFHRADNYGALLQAFALQKTLSDLGHDVEIVDYRCKAIEDAYVYYIVPKLRKNLIKWFLDFMIVNPKANSKRDKCNEFRRNFLKLTESVRTIADRKYIQDSYDVLVTGSDQIWNEKITRGKDDWYCFKRKGDAGTKLISYGASVGNLKQFRDCFEQYRCDLEKYDKISVREQEVADFLEQKLQRTVSKIVDPTLLLSETAWEDLIDRSTVNVKGEYLFYYDVEMNPVSMAIAKKLSSMRGIKLVHFNQSSRMLFQGRLVQEAGPCEFLSLIKNSRYVVTSSFHATVFSIILKKQFIAVPHPFTGSRVRGLLADFDLSSRVVESYEMFSLDMVDETIDFDNVRKLVALQVDQAIDWLKTELCSI